ncbi:exonuclease subunit SbcD [Photorhabdus laumondii subsp. laumondii]|uniref:Nuclease SbcCD subunit D n=3 Tax=Photorhabdus laumondii TaxID=2218628 RepID=Q7N0H6_PHOLL|nr:MULTISPECIES: exonuclease subunit SbcD [Photorhabdus]AWK43515.1 exonuclease subunit SbcD [Photorhabdus laumondii subsp. laumondii]AXG44193.1 exonuclease subunit SbcD [Photorhabdus laumondii subsp. laumondii]AXG48821.1 exonuclease subunit SbcD [Photorhabdus laumondii subsp. laumondii]KTL63390.1 DNA exonuclease SbcCD subunit SbcD [Photorhabdus laumondii subsp. laumondii]MCC8382704.1 exonuclease subunit SbcD [Photorhabdus laumondii]
MRIIHTSDWHLGQYFFTKSRAAEHQHFLRWLIKQIEHYQVDALIVAGDIFDTGSPPSYARELYNRFVVELQPTGCQLISLGGNHDSVATLNESKELLSCLNTTVIAHAEKDQQKQIKILTTKQGNAGAILCAVPFLRPRDIMISQAGQSGEQKQLVLQEAIAEHYHRLYQQACELRDELNLPLPIIATGHLTTVGATVTDSVRDIYIGTLDAFPAQAFPPVDYIALGHIHRPQIVAKSEHIRYSGSPIPLSFDEVGQEKSVCLVEFTQDKLESIKLLPIPQYQPMQLIKGNLQHIEQQLQTFNDYQGEQPVWLDIEVATQDYLHDIQKRIRSMVAELPVEIILLRRSKTQQQNRLAQENRETLTELSVNEVFARRLAQSALEDEEHKKRLTTLFEQTLNDIYQAKNKEEQA